MNPQRKYRLGMASNNYWGWGGGGRGVKPVLRGPNLHPHLPLLFIQFSWLFGSHGGLLAHQCFIKGNNENQCNDRDEAKIRTRQLQRVETPGAPMGVSNITETQEQKKTSMGQETDKCPAPTNQIFSFMLGLL